MMNFSAQEAYWMVPPMLGIRRRPRLTLGFHDYVHRPHGLFDFFEILGGLTVYMMMSSVPLACRASPFLRACSFTCSLGGVHMIVSSMLSPVSAYYLPRIFYIVGLSTGGLHALHFTYAFYKLYIETWL
ncbi:hypothetical protein HPB52_024146 [Rhipicephalus sanguineus]|uniref:Uncharacterized protein n=1 Tax=Rhipicephalus sanguineus TaxID=34632 RepID=A0A9D4T6H3_RHISA|nr:hypothetical protein HPB52_024146 [Rhipicephalus sanguineus]